MLFTLQHPSVHNRLVSQAHISCFMPGAFWFPHSKGSEFVFTQPTSVQHIMSSTSSTVSFSPKIINTLRSSVVLMKLFSFDVWLVDADGRMRSWESTDTSHVPLPSVEWEYWWSESRFTRSITSFILYTSHTIVHIHTAYLIIWIRTAYLIVQIHTAYLVV